jgi:hypothetical protein
MGRLGIGAAPSSRSFSVSISSALATQAGARRRELGRLGGDQRPQGLGIIRKAGTLDRHSSFISCREDTRY